MLQLRLAGTYSQPAEAEVAQLQLTLQGYRAYISDDKREVYANSPLTIEVDESELKTLDYHGHQVYESLELNQDGLYTPMFWVSNKTANNKVTLVQQMPEDDGVDEVVLQQLVNKAPIKLYGSDRERFVNQSDLTEGLDILVEQDEYVIRSSSRDLPTLQQEIFDRGLDVILVKDWSC